MVECLIDFIGLNYCEGVYEQPPSGIFLNSLPGISIESMDKIANSDQATYLGVWSDVQKSASDQFKIDVIAEVSKCFRLNKDCNYGELICTNKDILVQAWKYCLGVWLMIFRLNTNRLTQFTTVDRKQAEELKDFFQLQYESSLKQSVLLMDISECELCCGGNPEYVYQRP